MANKKTFVIPNNVDAKFEFLSIKAKDFKLFIPSVAISVVLILLPISIIAKIFIPLVLLFIPYALVSIPSVRPNIPIWQLLVYKIRYQNSQKEFYYRKEGVKLVQFQEEIEEKEVKRTREKRAKAKSKRNAVSATANTHQVRS